MKWPIREGLLKLVEIIKQQEFEKYKLTATLVAIRGGKIPEPPPILRS